MEQDQDRLVERYCVLGHARPLIERVADIVPRDTRFVVLDLDRTVHLGVTIGELLGWEILTDPGLRRQLDTGPPLPFFTLRRPLDSAVNLARGLRDWGLAGLMYASTVRLGNRWPRWDGLLARQLGTDYVDVVQSLMRGVLMAQASSFSEEELAIFAERAWRRTLHRLVIDRAVVDRIREHCPDLEAVILSSASTAPTVAHAAQQLGVDSWVASSSERHDEQGRSLFATPASLPRWLVRGPKGTLSRPGALFHNSSTGKVRLLHMHHPELFGAGSVTVGISDNNFGEDRLWPDYFTHAVALNSRHPFSPFVGRRSPCESVTVLDAAPTGAGEPAAPAPPWHGALEERVFEGRALANRVGAEGQARLRELALALRAARASVRSDALGARRRELVALRSRFAGLVESYNGSVDKERHAVGRELRRLSRRLRAVKREVDRATRECTVIQHALESHKRRTGLEVSGRVPAAG